MRFKNIITYLLTYRLLKLHFTAARHGAVHLSRIWHVHLMHHKRTDLPTLWCALSLLVSGGAIQISQLVLLLLFCLLYIYGCKF